VILKGLNYKDTYPNLLYYLIAHCVIQANRIKNIKWESIIAKFNY